jgi:hypothetical protein
MSAADPSTFDSLALVSSFYGPGATACWYLTCLSCLISWTIHPKKQKTDSITSDFIAAVTFPTVAAAHLIAQVQNYPDQASLGDRILQQDNASLSASLTINKTYLAICTVLLVPTGLRSSVKRICLLAVTETYLFFAVPSARDALGAFPRSFIIGSLEHPLLVGALVLVSVLVGILLSFLYLVFDYSRLPPVVRPPPDAEPELIEISNQVALMKNTAAMTRMTYLALPFNFLGSLISSSSFAKDMLPHITTRVQQPAASSHIVAKGCGRVFPEDRYWDQGTGSSCCTAGGDDCLRLQFILGCRRTLQSLVGRRDKEERGGSEGGGSSHHSGGRMDERNVFRSGGEWEGIRGR